MVLGANYDLLDDKKYSGSGLARGSRADRRVEEIVALIPRRRVMQASLQKAGYEIKHVRKLLYGRLKVYMIKAGP